MAVKTITIDLEAYEALARRKRTTSPPLFPVASFLPEQILAERTASRRRVTIAGR